MGFESRNLTMSDSEDLSGLDDLALDEEIELELEVEALEQQIKFKSPNCFASHEPKAKWEWNQLEELKNGKINFPCHFAHRFDGLFIENETKIKEIDLSQAECNISQFVDFFELIADKLNQVEVLRFPNFSNFLGNDYATFFTQLKLVPNVAILDLSNCKTFDYSSLDEEFFKIVSKFNQLKEINLPLTPIRSEKDCNVLKSLNLPVKLQEIHLGTFDVSVTQQAVSKFRNIGKLSCCYEEIQVVFPSYYKVQQEPLQKILNERKRAEPKYQSSSEELKKSAVNKYWNLSRIHDLTNDVKEKVKIAVLDSGLHACQTQFFSQIKGFRSSVGSFASSDNIGRGTHTTGLISLLTEGKIDFLIGKVVGSDGNIEEENLVDAIKWANSEGADIICILSALPTATHDKLFKTIYETILAGKIIICGAGDYRGNIGYPGKFGNLICVAAENESGKPLVGQGVGREIDFIAPGENIWSFGVTEKFVQVSGAAPAVGFAASLCGLLLTYDRLHDSKIKNIEQMKNLLRSISSNSDDHNSASGYGRLLPSKLFRSNWSDDKIKSTFYEYLSENFFY